MLQFANGLTGGMSFINSMMPVHTGPDAKLSQDQRQRLLIQCYLAKTACLGTFTDNGAVVQVHLDGVCQRMKWLPSTKKAASCLQRLELPLRIGEDPSGMQGESHCKDTPGQSIKQAAVMSGVACWK